MRRSRFASVVCAVFFAMAVSGIACAADSGPETIEFPGGKKGVVTFNHKQHQEKFKCGECHHGPGHSDYTEGMEIKKCEECHNKEMANKKLNKPMKAFHKNCKGCHKEQGGPTKCKECHVKK